MLTLVLAQLAEMECQTKRQARSVSGQDAYAVHSAVAVQYSNGPELIECLIMPAR